MAWLQLIFVLNKTSAEKEVDLLGPNCGFKALKEMIQHFIFRSGRICLGATHLLCISMKDPVYFP